MEQSIFIPLVRKIQMADQFFAALRRLLPGALKILAPAFKIPPDLPICHTRIIREARGFPWNNQVGVHPLKDGHLSITLIKPPLEQP
jgi:hypothetical protein